jgi:hypothetical protein
MNVDGDELYEAEVEGARLVKMASNTSNWHSIARLTEELGGKLKHRLKGARQNQNDGKYGCKCEPCEYPESALRW